MADKGKEEANKAKRHLKMDNLEQMPVQKAKKSTEMNTAVEVTECTSRRRTAKQSNDNNKAGKVSEKANNVLSNKNARTRASKIANESQSKNNNATFLTDPVPRTLRKSTTRSKDLKSRKAGKSVQPELNMRDLPQTSTAGENEETLYDRIYRKAQENLAKKAKEKSADKDTLSNEEHNAGEGEMNQFDLNDEVMVNVNASEDDFDEDIDEDSDDEMDESPLNKTTKSPAKQINEISGRQEISGLTAEQRELIKQWDVNPAIQHYVQNLVEEQFEKMVEESGMAPPPRKRQIASTVSKPGNSKVDRRVPVELNYKSPSDTTIY